MNKLLKNLSNVDNQLLVKRAESINTRAKMTYESLINKIKLEIEEKKLKLQDLTDMGPDSTTSLNPASASWNPSNWVNEIQKYKLDIYDLQIQLKLAMESFLDLFGDDEKNWEVKEENK